MEPRLTTHDSYAHPTPQPKRNVDRFSYFCTGDSRVSLYFRWGAPFPLKIAPCHGGSEPPSNTGFLGPTRAHNPNGISVGLAVFAGLKAVTDKQKDHQTTLLALYQQAASTYIVLRCSVTVW